MRDCIGLVDVEKPVEKVDNSEELVTGIASMDRDVLVALEGINGEDKVVTTRTAGHVISCD